MFLRLLILRTFLDTKLKKILRVHLIYVFKLMILIHYENSVTKKIKILNFMKNTITEFMN